ncbi:GAF domain-containing protein [Candidatus Nitrospira bockiana]
MTAVPSCSPRVGRSSAIVLLALFLAIWAAAVVVTLKVVRHLEEALVAAAGTGLAQAAGAVAEALNRVLFEHSVQVQVIAQAPVLRQGSPETAAGYLRSLKLTLPEYMDIRVTDAAGRVIAATDARVLDRVEIGQPWFQSLVGRGQLEVRHAELFDVGSRRVLFPAPIIGDEGQFVGAVVLDVGFQSLEFVLEAARRAAQHVRLSGQAGSVDYRLLAPDGQVVYDTASRGAKRAATGSIPRLDDMGGKPGYREERDRVRGVVMVTGYAGVTEYGRRPDAQWVVLAGLDRRAILAPFERVAGTVMMWGALAILALLAALAAAITQARRRFTPAAPAERPVPAPRAPSNRPPVARRPPQPALPRADDRLPVPPRHEEADRYLAAALDPASWDGLKRWVRLAEVNRVCLFKNHRGEDGALWASRRYEWIGLGEVAKSEWSQWFSWSLRAKGFARWETELREGRAIGGRVADLPAAEAAALASCGIRTVLVVPLFVERDWWGFLEFDHCLSERGWSPTEVQALTSAARLLESALRRPTEEERLERVLAVIDAVLESTADGVLVVDGDGQVVSFNQRLIGMWKIPEAVIDSRTLDEFMGWMMRQLAVPEVMLRTVSELNSEPEAESYDILELQDGRRIERVSKPRRDGARVDGRTWTFREVSPAPPASGGDSRGGDRGASRKPTTINQEEDGVKHD